MRAGQGVDPTSDIAQLVASTKDPLLGAVRLSHDFFPAYSPLLAMAQQLHAKDPSGARALLTELSEANPQRPEAAKLRTRLFGSER